MDKALARAASQRTRAMYAMYVNGATLEEVGARFGVTRERVRQIFQEAGIPTRSITETNVLRHDRLVHQHSDEICAAFLESRDIGAVARQLDIPRIIVQEVVKQHFPSDPHAHPRRARPQMYPTSELIAFLQEAGAAVSGRLTTGAYAKYAKGRRTDDGRPWPSFQTHAKRFGTWSKAVARAKLIARSSRKDTTP
jgi:hypothetical protein